MSPKSKKKRRHSTTQFASKSDTVKPSRILKRVHREWMRDPDTWDVSLKQLAIGLASDTTHPPTREDGEARQEILAYWQKAAQQWLTNKGLSA